MRFSPTDIAYFLETARLGHVGRAALSVGVTQPAVSKAIRRLEQAVGVPLFDRAAHGVLLTGEGHLFLESARRFDAQHAELQHAAMDLRAQHGGLLRVGLTQPTGDSAVVRVLAEMVRRRPGLRLTLTIGKSDALSDAVQRGELDVAGAPAYPGLAFGCNQLKLGEDRVRVAARVGHPLAHREDLALSDLAAFSWVMPSRGSASRRLVTQMFEQAGLPAPRVTMEADYMTDAVLGLVAGTDLLVVAPASVLHHWFGRVNALLLAELDLRRTVVLLSRTGASWSPLMVAFRELLQQAGPGGGTSS